MCIRDRLGAGGTELDIGDPVGVLEALLGPDGTAVVARRGRGEDQFVGEQLRGDGYALDGEVGHGGLSIRIDPTRCKAIALAINLEKPPRK